MTMSSSDISNEVKACFKRHYLPTIHEFLKHQHHQMTLIFEHVKQYSAHKATGASDHQALADYKRNLHQLIGPMWEIPTATRYFQAYSALENALTPVLEGAAEKVTEEQYADRFYPKGHESSGLKIKKTIKRLFFNLHRLPVRMLNWVKSNPTKIHYWSHTIPLRNLAIQYFRNEHISLLTDIDTYLFQSTSAAFLKLKLWEESVINRGIDHELEEQNLSTFLQHFEQEVFEEVQKRWETAFSASADAFEEAYPRVGTWEYPNRMLQNNAIERSWTQTDAKWTTHHLQWRNTIYALFEEWRSDLDIYTLRHETLAELDDFQKAQIKRLGEQIDPEVNEIDDVISAMRQTVAQEELELKKVLTKVNYQTKKQLDQVLIPRLKEKLSSQYILNLIAKLEVNIQKSIEDLSKAHVVVKTKTYDYPMETEALQRISPYELIAFETLGYFQNELSTTKKGLFETLELANEQISDLDHLISFNLKAALSVLAEDESSTEVSQKTALEGLERAQLRLNETKQTLDSQLQAHGEQVARTVHVFCERIMELTENENIEELRRRISKAKTAKQREERRLERKLALKSTKEQLFSHFRRTVDQAEELIDDINARLLLSPAKRLIDKEVSDLLVDSRSIIDQLPLVYQRLYSIEPLQDMELFEGRQKELKQIEAAFESWEKGRFAATIVFGEKWGGQTSFMTYAIETSKFPYQVIRHAIKQTVHSETDLLELLRTLFKKSDFQTIEEVKEYLASGPRRVVVLEDLQNVFLRTIGGFAGIRLLLEFINGTCKEVFWVTTTTLYSWQYLSKSIAMHDFFSYPIQMQPLTDEEITSIIWKRNRISGYEIQFTTSSKRLADKKFKNLKVDEQQLVLKRDFFAALNAFAYSNISLALIFWLLSTQEVKGNTLIMGAFKKPDFSFMNTLSSEKVHVLNAMIVHDGLTERQLQKVLNVAEGTLRMTLLSLLEDGVLFVKDDTYMVNAMLYRSTIAMLKDKNLIH